MKPTLQKLEEWVIPYGENFIILTLIVLTDPPVWQTDRRAKTTMNFHH